MNKKVLITKNMTFKERIAARKAAREQHERDEELKYQANRVRHAAKYGMSVPEYDRYVQNVLDKTLEAVKKMTITKEN